MFIADDLLTRSLGFTENPFDLIWLMDKIHKHALKEKWDIEEINNRLKENRLKYEFNEITEEEYQEREDKIQEELKIAKKVRQTEIGGQEEIDIL